MLDAVCGRRVNSGVRFLREKKGEGRMNIIGLALLVALLFIPTFPQPFSSALCSCPSLSFTSDEERKAALVSDFTRADAVFSGEVVELDTFKVKIKVDKLWKGEKAKEIGMVIRAVNDNNPHRIYGCDYRFKLGEKYLVYAYETPLGLRTHECSRTRPMKNAKKEMEELEEIAARDNDN
jgi:hypothetical protein